MLLAIFRIWTPHTCFYDDICSVLILNLATSLFESLKSRATDHEKMYSYFLLNAIFQLTSS